MKKIITYGTFDMLHIGHINILTTAKARGDYLIVAVTSEDYDRSRGKLNVSQSQEDRYQAIANLSFVDEVIYETHKHQKIEDMQKYEIDEFVIGDDWVGKFDYLNRYTKVVYVPRTAGVSSTKLRLQNIKSATIGLGDDNQDTKRFIKETSYVDGIDIVSNDNFDKLLNTDIDAVYIACDIKDRYTRCKKALQNDKHILCENPVSLKDGEIESLFEVAKKHDKIFLMAIKTAFMPAFNKLLEVINHSDIGDIKEIKSTFTTLYKQRGFSHEFIKHGATNLLLHYPALLVQKIAGRHESVSFFPQIQDGYDISNRAITTHKNGMIGLSTVGVGMKSQSDAVISGTKGYIKIPAPWWLTKSFATHFEDTTQTNRYEYEFEGDGLRYMIAEFSQLIQRAETNSSRLTQDDMIELNKIVISYNHRSSL